MSKNKTIENQILRSKQYLKTWTQTTALNSEKNCVYHCYNPGKVLGWWDDVSFKLGSQLVMVWWVHPRMRYSDITDGILTELFPYHNPFENPFDESTPNYKFLGKNKNRKKISSYTMKPSKDHLNFSQYCAEYRTKLAEMQKTSDVVITPSLKVSQLNFGRGVDLCLPIEVVDEKSLNEMAYIAKQLLTNKTTLAELYPQYTYSKSDWVKELPKEGI